MKKKLLLSVIILVILVCLTIIIYYNNSYSKVKIYDKDDISMVIKDGTLTRDGATIIITDNSGKEHTYGEAYIIEKKVNGKWKKAKTLNEDIFWNAIGYVVDSNNKLELDVNWKSLYGNLKNGKYRLLKDFALSNDGYIACEFEIDDSIISVYDEINKNFTKIKEVSNLTSSNPYDYIDNEYYQNIVDLGKPALYMLKYMYNTKELTGVDLYISALAIEDITECNLNEKYNLDWSTAEEFYNLWENYNCNYK